MNFYVYLHRRPDTGAVFYVGRGKIYKRSTILPRRAHTKIKRNSIWHGIVNRNDGRFEVEILGWCETAEEINQFERDTIKRFGKIIDGTGTLCNLIDGGEGIEGYSHSDLTKTKLKEAHARNPSRLYYFKTKEFKNNRLKRMKELPPTMLGKKHSEAAKLKMSIARKGSKHYAAKNVIDVWNGAVYGCVEDAAKSINIGKWSLYKALSGERKNNTTMRYENAL